MGEALEAGNGRRLAKIRTSRRAGVRLAIKVAAGLAMTAVGLRALEEIGANAIVGAPNAEHAPEPLAHEIVVPVDGARLSIDVVEPASSVGTIFVLHGIRDSKESMRGWAKIFSEAGFRAVLVDHRGHGRSAGSTMSYGVRESTDLSAVLDALVGRGYELGPVGVLGYSYGAAVGIQWAGIDRRVRAVLAVAPFSSLREVVDGYVPVPVPSWFLNAALDRAGRIGNFDPDLANTALAITRTDAAVMLVHGRNDPRIPFAHSERILAARRDRTEIFLVDGANHDNVTSDPKLELWTRAPRWFARALTTAKP